MKPSLIRHYDLLVGHEDIPGSPGTYSSQCLIRFQAHCVLVSPSSSRLIRHCTLRIPELVHMSPVPSILITFTGVGQGIDHLKEILHYAQQSPTHQKQGIFSLEHGIKARRAQCQVRGPVYTWITSCEPSHVKFRKSLVILSCRSLHPRPKATGEGRPIVDFYWLRFRLSDYHQPALRFVRLYPKAITGRLSLTRGQG
jgi:hypothetical protein